MASLEALPTELLFLVTNHLPNSALLSLRLSSKHLYLRLPSLPSIHSKSHSHCESQALNRVITERALLALNQRRCILCNGVQSTDFFIGSTPICQWHKGWFLYRCIPAEILPAIQAELQEESKIWGDPERQKWIAVKRMYCAHERNILGWHVGECCCGCDSCGWWQVTCYIRVSPGSKEVEDIVRFSPPPLDEVGMEKTTILSSQWCIRNPGPWVIVEDQC